MQIGTKIVLHYTCFMLCLPTVSLCVCHNLN